MKQIRIGVFETNSSSTHSITMCSQEEYSKWKNGEVIKAEDIFITREQAIEELKNDKYFKTHNPNFDFSNQDAVDEALNDNEYLTYKEYFADAYLETFEEAYTTKNGEKIVAFGKYGYDG